VSQRAWLHRLVVRQPCLPRQGRAPKTGSDDSFHLGLTGQNRTERIRKTLEGMAWFQKVRFPSIAMVDGVAPKPRSLRGQDRSVLSACSRSPSRFRLTTKGSFRKLLDNES